ncbi:MAG TPA: hypothetical protein VLA36_10525 [Longimicrobiales bacterium]|nr:hypothetical protein [Longimicrobiales bacterium]
MPIQTIYRRVRSRIGALTVVAALLPSLTACDLDFFDVKNPNVIDAASVDPVADGEIFSRSAFQTLASAFSGGFIIYTAWFTNEAWVGDTFPTRNEFGRRLIDDRNGTHNGSVWSPITQAIAQGEQVLEILGGEPGQDLNLARGAFTSAYGLVMLAEAFCEGTMRGPGGEPGPLMTPTQLLETAADRFDKAITFASGATGTEASNILNASKVGKGRALLQMGSKSEAAAAVAGVASSFEFNVAFVDDAGNRGRLGNGVYFYSAGGSREALVVPPHYRDMNDPRVTFWDSGRNAQDGVLRLWSQTKYDNWAAPIRLASGLEARYIEVEAGGNAGAMLAFINERRAVGNQAPITTTDASELLAELMAQRSRDFWLDGHRMGDWRRNPNSVPNILQPGDNYYKPEVGTVSNQTCMPLPFAERNANPNIGS